MAEEETQTTVKSSLWTLRPFFFDVIKLKAALLEAPVSPLLLLLGYTLVKCL